MADDVVTLADLHQDSQNARAHNPRNLKMIVDALQEVGAARSGVIDEDGRILAGNATWEALAEAGIERVRVVEADGNEWVVVKRSGLTEEQKRRLALYDNRAAELADWDAEMLAGLLALDEDVLDGLWYENELFEVLNKAEPVLPSLTDNDLPALKGEHLVAIHCSADDLLDFESVLNEWNKRDTVTVDIS